MIDDDVAFYKDALWYAIIGEEMINQSFCWWLYIFLNFFLFLKYWIHVWKLDHNFIFA